MLIKALSVEGVGRFSTPVQVDGFGDGVNVLAAGNEVGKSTLFKAIRTCLFCRHDSRTQDIRDIGSDGSQLAATVQIAFEQNGRAYVIRKAFCGRQARPSPKMAARLPGPNRPTKRYGIFWA